jgi:hypothetical protein
VTEASADLDALVRELKTTATELREGKVQAPEAAGLVDRCAELAAGIAAELDRQVLELESDPPDQESLL